MRKIPGKIMKTWGKTLKDMGCTKTDGPCVDPGYYAARMMRAMTDCGCTLIKVDPSAGNTNSVECYSRNGKNVCVNI